MSQQRGGRIVAASFLAGLVAATGVGPLVLVPLHESLFAEENLPRHRQAEFYPDQPPAAPISDAAPPSPKSNGKTWQGTGDLRRLAPASQGVVPVQKAQASHRPVVLVAAPVTKTASPLLTRTSAVPPPVVPRIDTARRIPNQPSSTGVGRRSPQVIAVQFAEPLSAGQDLAAAAASAPPPAVASPETKPVAPRIDRHSDPDSINWSHAPTDAVQPLEPPAPGSRRGPVADWLRDSFDDIKSARSQTVPFPRRPTSSTATGSGRLIERLRLGERLLARDRKDASAPTAPHGEDYATGICDWPVAIKLHQQIDLLAKPGGSETTASVRWAADTGAILKRLRGTRGPCDPTAATGLAALESTADAGMRLADSTTDATRAATLRRAALAVQRRSAVWKGAIDVCTQAADRSDAAARERSGDLLAESRLEADIIAVLAALERLEESGSAADAAAIAAAVARIEDGRSTSADRFADAVRTHYSAANVRVAVHQKFLERLLPVTSVTTAPVDDRVLGRQVRGTSTLERSTGVRFVPDTDGISMNLEIRGDVASRTVTASGPVSLTSNGSSSFTVRKPVTIGEQGLVFGAARGSASSRSHLSNIQTSFDGVPIMRSLVRNIARNQHDEHLPEANREVIDKIIARACREVDQQAEPQFTQMADKIRLQAWEPLERLGLEPTALALETTAGVATARLRLAAQDQLAAHTPRPRAPAGSLLSVQVHQSAVNNALERLGLAGRQLSLEELVTLLCERAGIEPRVPEETPEGVEITFAAEQPLWVEYRDGLVHVRISLDSIESGRRSWRDIVASVTYRPKAVSPQIFLEREGPVHIGGPGHQGRAELALRAIFGKIFPKERPLPLLPETIASNPRITDLAVLQAASTDGWFAISLGELPAPVAVAAPARRTLRK